MRLFYILVMRENKIFFRAVLPSAHGVDGESDFIEVV